LIENANQSDSNALFNDEHLETVVDEEIDNSDDD
jgi:hypothetical protein